MKSNAVVLITGAARRIGAIIARRLHTVGYQVILHYRHSKEAAEQLCQSLNKVRPQSALTVHADFNQFQQLNDLVNTVQKTFGRLDALVNNASIFTPTPLEQTSPQQWHELLNVHMTAPYFLAAYAAPLLRQSQGSIVNIIDIHGQKPLKRYPAYSISKAGLTMITKSLARELAPAVRVNGIAPGITLWPEHENAVSDEAKQELMERNALKRITNPEDIANGVHFLLEQTSMTGQILNIDAGRTLV